MIKLHIGFSFFVIIHYCLAYLYYYLQIFYFFQDYTHILNRYGNKTVFAGVLNIRAQIVEQKHPASLKSFDRVEKFSRIKSDSLTINNILSSYKNIMESLIN